jgi:hypothetical protein
VVGGVFNLIAAILCTVGAALSAAAMFLSEPSFVTFFLPADAQLRLSAPRPESSPPLFRSYIESVMTGHDYLNLAVAAVFVMINLLGATFAIKRPLHRRSANLPYSSMRAPGHVAPSKHQL